jgi:Fic-DOC domain mobile mystery protein B
MFGRVWRWAGDNRASNRDIGCEWREIDVQLRGAFADAATWIAFSSYPPDGIAIRFHHCLVAIHPFANGNGRWSRMMGDALARRLGQPSFSWGNSSLLDDDGTRRAYIDALRTADRHDIGPLLTFARS